MRIIYCLLFGVAIVSCSHEKASLKAGEWRGTIEMQGQSLPFNFEVLKTPSGDNVNLKNGAEKLLLDDVSISGDSVKMVLHIFDAQLLAKVEGDKLTGYFIKNDAKDYRLPFSATYGDDFRFAKAAPATVDYSGKYQVRFMSTRDTTVSVGIFDQHDNHVTGTFLVPDGDYRYLEGNVVDGRLMLSTFDGNHAFLFNAGKSGDTLRGDYYSGRKLHKTWIAVKNDQAKMPDAESLTHLKPGFEKIEFSFPGLDKTMVSPSDAKYKDKVLVLQIFGTWCPNCMDETKFLAPWYRENKKRGVEILGMAYEQKDDFDYVAKRIRNMKEKLKVDYDFVIAGVEKKAAPTLPALANFMGFPTTIFIGRDGKVKVINTGFTGPGTGIYYDQYIQRFNEIINELLNQQAVTARASK